MPKLTVDGVVQFEVPADKRLVNALSDEAGVPRIAGELARLLRDEEAIEAGDVERVFARAGEAYLALCGQPRLVDALASGEPIFEVPFSVRPAAAPMILRGTFDCLVRRRDGGITVLELKTGTPAPGHEQQLATYVAAARALFPDAPVEGTLVYARDGAP